MARFGASEHTLSHLQSSITGNTGRVIQQQNAVYITSSWASGHDTCLLLKGLLIVVFVVIAISELRICSTRFGNKDGHAICLFRQVIVMEAQPRSGACIKPLC